MHAKLAKRSGKFSSFVAFLSATAVALGTATAFASSVSATGGITQMEYPQTFLMIQYAGVNYHYWLKTFPLSKFRERGCSWPKSAPR
jgi:putative flippase GtrA